MNTQKCPACNVSLTWVAQYGQWYCANCKRYIFLPKAEKIPGWIIALIVIIIVVIVVLFILLPSIMIMHLMKTPPPPQIGETVGISVIQLDNNNYRLDVNSGKSITTSQIKLLIWNTAGAKVYENNLTAFDSRNFTYTDVGTAGTLDAGDSILLVHMNNGGKANANYKVEFIKGDSKIAAVTLP